jgi:soluble lytic murein transglycosylase-like protein
MQPRNAALRFSAALILGFAFSVPPAGAAETAGPSPENYAAILRTINPDLQRHESVAYARSVLADAQRSHVDPALVVALVSVESSWRPGAVSPSGARGLGQLMPTTAHKLGVADPWDPAQNLRGVTAYLRSLINRFAGRGVDTLRYAIGAYNAGPRAVELFQGLPNTGTRRYVTKVFAQWESLNARIARTVADTATAVPDDERAWLAGADQSALAADATR